MNIHNQTLNSKIPLAVFFASILVAFFAFLYIRNNIEHQQQVQFQSFSKTTTLALENRGEIFINSLYGARGLYAASHSVERNEWSAYITTTDVLNRYQGLSLMAYAPRVSAAEVAAFEKSVRQDTSVDPAGYPDFTVRPFLQKNIYYPLQYIEPPAAATEELGFDLGSDPIRLAALNQAADSGNPVLTGLVQSDPRSEKEFSAYLAIYQNNSTTTTQAERQTALQGFVVAEFELQNFFGNIFKGLDIPPPVSITVSDIGNGGQGNEQQLFQNMAPKTNSDNFESNQKIDIAGRSWLVSISAPTNYNSSFFERQAPYWVLFMALILGFLVSGVLYASVNSQKRAQALAEKMTLALKESETKFRSIFENMQDVLYRTDLKGVISMASPSIEKYLGVPAAKLIGQNAESFYQDPEEREAMIRQLKTQGAVSDYPIMLLAKNNQPIAVSLSAHLIKNGQGEPVGIEGVLRDVTERKKTEDELKARTLELERINKITVDRELKMIELKKELEDLKKIKK